MSSINCKAAVAWAAKEDLVIGEVEVAPPRANEVRVKIVATGICERDGFALSRTDSTVGQFSIVLGHEGAGVVESVGDGVTSVSLGDHVICLYVPECMDCKMCVSSETNLCCRNRKTQDEGFMPDGTSRFTCKGITLYHYSGVSSFAEYTVLAEVSVARVRDNAPLESVCLLGGGVTSGVGAVRNTAKVEEGATVAVFGLGGIGLFALEGAIMAKARRVFAVDVNPEKFPQAVQFGATDCINPADYGGRTIQDVLIEMTDGGLDYTFDCTGNVNMMRAAFEACHKVWGQSVVTVVAAENQDVSTNPNQLMTGRVWRGSVFGGVKGRSQLGGFVDEYMDGKLKIDEFITKRYNLDSIDAAIKDMYSGKSIRGVIVMGS
jgi:S-(hydroxymethyl)glutathione dehydrogenase / alcohol dehydrogenase